MVASSFLDRWRNMTEEGRIGGEDLRQGHHLLFLLPLLLLLLLLLQRKQGEGGVEGKEECLSRRSVFVERD